jgi:hypothetical protein
LGIKQLADNKVIPISKQIQHNWKSIALERKLNMRPMQSSSSQAEKQDPKLGRQLPSKLNPKWCKRLNKKVDDHNPHNYLNKR